MPNINKKKQQNSKNQLNISKKELIKIAEEQNSLLGVWEEMKSDIEDALDIDFDLGIFDNENK